MKKTKGKKMKAFASKTLYKYVTSTATFSIGNTRYGWIPPQYFFDSH